MPTLWLSTEHSDAESFCRELFCRIILLTLFRRRIVSDTELFYQIISDAELSLPRVIPAELF